MAKGNADPERANEIKAILRALLIARCKQDVTLRQLNAMYQEEEGEKIPFRDFGYPSLDEFLQSMPDTLKLRYNREGNLCAYHVDTASTAHVTSLVSRQRRPPKKSRLSYSCRPRNSYRSPYYNSRHSSHVNTSANSLRTILEELKKDHAKYYQNGIRKSDILQRLKERPGGTSILNIQTLNVRLKELSEYLVIDDDFVYFKDAIISQKVHPGSQSGHKSLNTNYGFQNVVVRSPPSQNSTTRYQTEPQFNRSQPNPQLKQAQRPPPVQTSQRPYPLPMSNQGSELLKERIRIRLEKLIERHPEGIWAAELPGIYKKEYSIDLDYHELGFNSVLEFVSAIPDIFKIVKPDDTGRTMLLNAKNPLNPSENRQQTKTIASLYNYNDFIANDPEPVPTKLSSKVCQKFVPDGMMGCDDMIEPITVSSLSVEDFLEVNISEIFTPSFFWITLRKNKSKIKKLMDDLDEFYRHQDLDSCRLPQALVETGLNVACVYAQMWHRAIIKKLKPDGYVVVSFYDYGTVKTYNPNDLYYLHKKFSALPAQAIACGLHNVKAPESNEWPLRSTTLFVEKVWGVPLVATICEINEKNNTMMITLTDTSDDTVDIHINEWMIDEGLAERGKMENILNSKHHVRRYGVPLDKMCLYDEDVLKKRIKESGELLQNAKQEETKMDIDCIPTEQNDIRDVDSTSNYVADSSFDASTVATLVRENIDLTKQTNTIAQAILSNIKLDDSFESKTISSKANITKINDVTMTKSYSEDVKNFPIDVNGNLSDDKNNFSEINISSCDTDMFKTGSMYLQQKQNSELGSSMVSLSSQPSSFDCIQSTKQYSNELPDHRASNQSLFSRQSSISENNYQNQLESLRTTHQEYDQLSFTDGTPTFYKIKADAASEKKYKISIKYPSDFSNLINNAPTFNKDHGASINSKSTISNSSVDGRSSIINASDEGYQTAKFTSMASNALSDTSRAPVYIPIHLTDKCNRKTIHIFHLENEGWVPAAEFVDCFTNLKLERIMFKLLQTFKVDVNYKYLTRDTYPELFSQLDGSRVKAPRESDGRIRGDFVLVLLPLRAILHILTKLDFVPHTIFKEATVLMKQHKHNAEAVLFEKFNIKILFDVMNLLIQYRGLRRLHISVN